MSDKITQSSYKPSYYEKEYRPTIKIDNKQITDLFNLVGTMNINEVKQFMLIEHIPYNVVDNNGNTLIHRVILENDLLKTENQRLQMIKFLYNENTNPDAPNNNNITPIHLACMKQYINIIKFLIEIGVDINYQDNFGNTPLHRLFSGNIKIEEKTTIGTLIPKPKKVDRINTDLWRTERQKIWDDIKSSPFIEAINNTLKYSIGSEEEEINIVREFQEQLLQMNLDLTKKDNIKVLKDIQAASIHKFKGIIEKKWSKFLAISDIFLHQTEPDSWPQNDPSKLAVIKNSNTKKYITEMLAKSLSDMKKLLSDIKVPEFIDHDDINFDLLTNYINNNPIDLTLANMDDLHDNYINELNKYRISNDFADNIINLNLKTFIGGARICNIENNIDQAQYVNLFNKYDDLIIPTLVYTIFTDFATANTFIADYNILLGNAQQTEFYNVLAEFIVDLINNKLNINVVRIINLINSNFPMHRSLIPLLESFNQELNRNETYYESENKISWLYCFINNFLCNEGFRRRINRTESNLICDIRLSVIYLIAGLINNKSSITLSISQAMRKSLYSLIFNEDPAVLKFGFLNDIPNNLVPGSTLCALIYLIFTTDYINIVDNITAVVADDDLLFNHIDLITPDDINLNFIMKYTFRIFSNMNTDDLNIPPNFIPIFEQSSNNREHICNMISYYYKNMNQPPQNQMVADLIGLIRKTHDDNDDVPEIGIRGRLKRFIIPSINDRNILPFNNIFSVVEPNLLALSGTMRNSKLFKIIGDNEEALYLWTAIDYVLPSRVNFFLGNQFMLTNTVNDGDRMYVMKFIESYYLGLNFIGHCPSYRIIPEIDTPGGVIETRYNLYNFDHSLNPGPPDVPDDNIEYPSFQTLNNEFFNRPTNIISLGSVINNLHIRINRLVQLIADRLKFMFNNILQENSSSTYATVISYTYPLLLVLSNYSKIIKEFSTQIKNSKFKAGYDNIKDINNTDILDMINGFQEFKIGKFESNINQINGYIYLLYYLNANTDKMKLPKFIYHALGTNKPLVIFDAINKIDIINPNSNYRGEYETNTTNIDNRKGNIKREIGFFSNVINNVGYINKETLNIQYIISKNKKLPPSLKAVLFDFYRFNIIEVIKNNNTEINNELISVEVSDTNRDIQLLYLKAKIIEEIIQLYLKNKINEYGKEIYNQLIRGRLPSNITTDTEKLFEKIDFSIELNKSPNINNININTQEILKLYYSFVEPKNIKEQFYIYPDNYFGTNLLKTKYTININLDIIRLMLENGSNILIHNCEKISPLVMMIKNNYYKALEIARNNFNMYDKNNIYSPQYYLMQNYKNHLDSYDKLSESSYNEMVTIIQSNESYTNNILKYMDVSFNVVKYIVEQYITENMIRLDEDFDSTYMVQILALCGYNYRNINEIGKCKYNENLFTEILIPNVDEGITILNLINELNEKINKTLILLNKYNKEREELVKLNLNTNNVDAKLVEVNDKINQFRLQIIRLQSLEVFYQFSSPIITNLNESKIIKRYEELLTEMNNTYICYMDGWRQFANNINIERIPTLCINYQKINMMNMNNNYFMPSLEILHKFYKHNYHIIKTYFENPRYIDNNKVLGFTYDLLVHLTKTFICSNIESIIKKILYDYIISTQNIPIENILEQIDLMVSDIEDVLYNVIPSKFVHNSVNIYDNQEDEASYVIETVADILNNLIDLLKVSSYIEINDYTINILKNNIVQYFDTIVFKLINNWNVVIENIFIYHINHYRMIECMINIM